MALTESEKAALNLAFQKMLQVNGLPNGLQDSLVQIIEDTGGGGGDASTGDIAVNSTFATQAAITYYVDPTGSDSNPGTLAEPFLTGAGSLAGLPKRIKHPVTINFAAGTYVGFAVSGFHFEPGGYIALVGTQGQVSLTGLMSGTIASATAGSATTGTWATATVTGAGWTVNELRGYFLETTHGAGIVQYRAIVSNTIDTITVPGAWTSPAGGTFRIVEPSALIEGASAPRPADYINAAGVTGAIATYNNTGGSLTITPTPLGSIFIDSFKSGLSSTVNVLGAGQTVYVRRCKFDDATGSVILGTPGSVAHVEDCTSAPTANRAFIQISQGSTVVANRNVYQMSGTLGSAFQALGPGTMIMTNNYVYNGDKAVTTRGGFVTMVGDKLDGVAAGANRHGILMTGNQSVSASNVLSGQARLNMSAVTISNYGNAITAVGPENVVLEGVVAGTGNTVGINAAKGASIQVSSTTTLTGTTEISIDGGSFTLTQMRAAVPKTITSVEYGTKVYE